MVWHRLVACVLLAAATGTVTAAPDAAEGFPAHPVRIVVPYPPGGPNDSIARALGQHLTAIWKQSVVVENRPGASGIIGSDVVARAASDGLTLMLGSITHAILPGLNPKLPFDPIADFTPVSLVGVAPMLVVVHPSVPAHSVKELIALAKTRPGKLSYASTGNGTSIHLITEMFKRDAGVDIVHIPYNGSGPAMAALIGGTVQMMIEAMPSALPQVQAGRIRALAVTSPQRSPVLPDLPTMSEAALPGFDGGIWWGVLGPAGLSDDLLRKINADVNEALKAPQVRERFAALGITPTGTTPEAFAQTLRNDSERYARIIRAANVTMD
ncbi:tripartite tricarboxylate transporter substrate binding protein [Bordetella sp. BOR01]|uniref:tripartite tricarboxylate transporter substrate binding protein n=1 Tax=Bordetella sp. BOR01 TaxID=2854779 RepID=UPI001C450DBE|nr:tripartite tricarboxylate transporter substrate binding protein [Bordetella sp. BOR01]MBV7482163.1 tripartite tricarboxylate transporter substrate binding protein [Bordetella sp. BOR01]